MEELRNSIREEFKDISPERFNKVYKEVREKTYCLVKDIPLKILKKRILLVRELGINYDWENIFQIILEDGYIKNKNNFKEMWSHTLYIENFILNKKYKLMVEMEDDKEFLERLLIRVRLIKRGWSNPSIDRLLRIYYSNVSYRDDFLIFFYLLIKELFNINSSKKETKGRPEIPEDIKNILKHKKKEKNINKMRSIYNVYNLVNELKNDDLNMLIEGCKEERVVNILNKIKIYLENK
jgi:hypothetical protein